MFVLALVIIKSFIGNQYSPNFNGAEIDRYWDSRIQKSFEGG
jgi:hypothetical protein